MARRSATPTITVSNTAAPGAPEITQVEFDVRGSVIPDATFDPIGTAGDEGTQCLEVSSEGGTGFVVPGDPCSDPFSFPHEDSPGVPGNGKDGMTLDFTDFDAGEAIVFGVDVDPTQHPGCAGFGRRRSRVRHGAHRLDRHRHLRRWLRSLTNQLFGDGSQGGGEAVFSPLVGQAAPTGIEMLGVTTAPTVFPNNSVAGTVDALGPQTVQVSGPVGASVTLLAATGELQSPTPFDPIRSSPMRSPR